MADIATGKWGTCDWRIDDGGNLRIGPGIAEGEPDWPRKKISGSVLVGDGGTVVLPENCVGAFAGLGEAKSVLVWDTDGSRVVEASSMFQGCAAADIDLKSLALPNAVDLSSMFADCSNVPLLDVSGLEAVSAVSTEGMFDGCRSLSLIMLPDMTGGKLTSARGMFSNCPSLRRVLGLDRMNMSNVESARQMFAHCWMLRDIQDAEQWGMSSCRDAAMMFYNCHSLDPSPAWEWDPRKLEDAADMFAGCTELKTADLSAWSVPALYDTGSMFYDCAALTEVIPPDPALCGPIAIAYRMFAECTKLESADLTGWNLAPDCDADKMFALCTSLKHVEGAEKLAGADRAFEGCISLPAELTGERPPAAAGRGAEPAARVESR